MAKRTSIKLVITNFSALKAKYGAAGLRRISSAFRKLAASDRKREIDTRVLAIDSAAQMKKLGGKPVAKAEDMPGAKAAVDAACRKLAPDYVLILGAWDVIPHQELQNPAAADASNGDPDSLVPSDLPYACDADYDKSVRSFLSPTRVVGRLPNVPGDRDPEYLLWLLQCAVAARPSARAGYLSYFAVTAKVWHTSTELSVKAVFGGNKLNDVPPARASWPKGKLAALTHFYNCHGADVDPTFYGQRGETYPPALHAAYLRGNVALGTVVAAECCYGAQLYDAKNAAGQSSICNTYLGEGACGVFGSSTVAYGPADSNDDADLICQYFLERVLKGASLGRATLEARQHFLQRAGTLDPIELKTIAQFNLMGDPSTQPVIAEESDAARAFNAKFLDRSGVGERALRRARLAQVGAALGQTVGAAAPAPRARAPLAVRKLLVRVAAEVGVKKPRVSSFHAHRPKNPAAKAFGGPGIESFHVAIGTRQHREAPGRQVVAVVAAIQDGRVARLRRVFSR